MGYRELKKLNKDYLDKISTNPLALANGFVELNNYLIKLL